MSRVWELISSKILVWGGKWETAESSVRAFIFEKMLELARDRVKFYQSDLFHDALWLRECITGPMSFEWVAREGGTFIGESAWSVNVDSWADATKYRFELLVDEKERWTLNVYESKESYRNLQADGSVQHDGDTCPQHENDGSYGNAVTFPNIPTLGNNFSFRKENKMDDIIRDLREKFEEAESAKEQLEEYQQSINDGIDELESYMNDLSDLIDSLDSLPEASVYVDLDTVQFDS